MSDLRARLDLRADEAIALGLLAIPMVMQEARDRIAELEAEVERLKKNLDDALATIKQASYPTAPPGVLVNRENEALDALIVLAMLDEPEYDDLGSPGELTPEDEAALAKIDIERIIARAKEQIHQEMEGLAG